MEQQPNLSSVKRARREKIVAAARDLFVERGFRATTMEAIADAVGMSKVTVYGYFRDKDAVFRAVAKDLAREMGEAVTVALGAPGDPADRIADALVAKHAIADRVVRRSIHASELFVAKDRAAGAIFDELDARIVDQIAEILVLHGGTDAKSTAHLLFASTQGIADRAADRAAMERDVRRIVDAIVLN